LIKIPRVDPATLEVVPVVAAVPPAIPPNPPEPTVTV
jgi:hypothetical protein